MRLRNVTAARVSYAGAVTLVLGCACLFMLRRVILRRTSAESWTGLITLVLFRPADYYSELTRTCVPITKSGCKVAISVVHRYVGSHAIELFPMDDTARALEGEVSRASWIAEIVRPNSEPMFLHSKRDGLSPFRTKDEAGYIIAFYSVGKALLVDTRVTIYVAMEPLGKPVGVWGIRLIKVSDS